MCKFYDINGKEMDSWKTFVDCYNKFYYLDHNKWIIGMSQSSRCVENIIDEILKRGIKNNRDLLRVVAWKLGKINHEASEMMLEKDPENGCFVYDTEWKDAENWEKDALNNRNPNLSIKDLILLNRGGKLEITNMAEYIIENADKLFDWSKDNPQKVLNELKDKKPKQIGTVYLITLLYFLSHGECPIYDQFAFRALEAIRNSVEPGDKIDVPRLPGKESTCRFKSVYGDYILPFKEGIAEVFGGYENYIVSRNIDRALWVYGHLFLPMKNGEAKEKV